MQKLQVSERIGDAEAMLSRLIREDFRARQMPHHYYLPMLYHLCVNTDAFQDLRIKKSISDIDLSSYETPKFYKKLIREAVQGKKVLELGCRSGVFLEYLSKYGAAVKGLTTVDVPICQKRIGKQNTVVSPVLDLSKADCEDLQKWSPDLVLSCSFLTAWRFEKESTPHRQILNKFAGLCSELACSETLFIIVGAIEGQSILTSANFTEHKVDGDFYTQLHFMNRPVRDFKVLHYDKPGQLAYADKITEAELKNTSYQFKFTKIRPASLPEAI